LYDTLNYNCKQYMGEEHHIQS